METAMPCLIPRVLDTRCPICLLPSPRSPVIGPISSTLTPSPPISSINSNTATRTLAARRFRTIRKGTRSMRLRPSVSQVFLQDKHLRNSQVSASQAPTTRQTGSSPTSRQPRSPIRLPFSTTCNGSKGSMPSLPASSFNGLKSRQARPTVPPLPSHWPLA